ncbi:MATE family efflux transporter [Streptococcus equinus]|uniref:Efflux protein, MATE family n=1 Tax=Streptococcus equinus TaxID=1335 RepID=A0AAE8HLU5_STREI|nr:MATE family efflux transporter [Streptococcus equinus]SDW95792.1 putative efflux protein, MATE family [Streptococcus equinus]SEQ01542.1 putative efflux protein, MATE family [Streptococcus equinus]
MQDLTQGKPIKVIILFTIPLIIGSFFQLAYNFADAMIVGHTLGQTAFASIGATGSLTFLIIGFAQGLTGGFSIIVAQRFGAKDYVGLKRSYVHGLFYTIVVSLILSIFSLLFLRQLLELMQTPDSLIKYCERFLISIFGGAVFTVLFNYLSNVLRAVGNSTTPLIALVLACLMNIGLDFLYILALHMGVFGAGVATVEAQLFSVIFLLIYIKRKVPYFHLKRSDYRLNSADLKLHARLGFPMAFQNSIIALGSLTLQIVLNNLGTVAIAAQSITAKTDQLAMLPMMNLAQAMSTFTAQNYGAHKFKRLIEGLRHTLYIVVIWAIAFALLLVTFDRFFSGLFINHPSENVYHLAKIAYMINGLCYWILAILFIVRSFIQGLGRSFAPTLAGVMELIMRVVVSIVGHATVGYAGVVCANPAAWCGSVVILIPSAIIYKKRLIDVVDKNKTSC